MNDSIIDAYLWEDIIRLGFSPSGDKNIKSWLYQYGKNLKSFWEIENYPASPQTHKNEFASTIDSSSHLEFSFQYSINTINKFGISLLYSPPVNEKELMWVHDMDGQYISFPNQMLLTNHNQRSLAVSLITDHHLGRVIDSLIIHPTPHQHIESPIDNHGIRIGGGILNPFLYLFHLRVQLCPDQPRRDAERIRLIDLFKEAVKNNQPIPINCLMKVP